MKVEITNLRFGTRISVAWQAKQDGGLFQPAGSWIHTEGSTAKTQRGTPQKFGFYVVRAFLPDHKLFEHTFQVTEKLTTVKISYRKIT